MTPPLPSPSPPPPSPSPPPPRSPRRSQSAVARVATHTATRLPRAAGHPERSAGLCLRRDAVGGPHASLHGRRVAPARRPGVHARRHGGQLAWRRLCKHTRIDGGCRGSHWQLHGRRLAVRPHCTINRRRDASRRVVANLAGHGVWCGERRGQWRLRDCARLLKGARRGADRRHQRRCAHRAQHGAHKPHLRGRAAAEPQHACIQPQDRRHLLARLRERRGARGFTALATAQPALAPTVPTRHTRALSGALTTPSTIIPDTAVVVAAVAATFAAAAAAASGIPPSPPARHRPAARRPPTASSRTPRTCQSRVTRRCSLASLVACFALVAAAASAAVLLHERGPEKSMVSCIVARRRRRRRRPGADSMPAMIASSSTASTSVTTSSST